MFSPSDTHSNDGKWRSFKARGGALQVHVHVLLHQRCSPAAHKHQHAAGVKQSICEINNGCGREAGLGNFRIRVCTSPLGDIPKATPIIGSRRYGSPRWDIFKSADVTDPLFHGNPQQFERSALPLVLGILPHGSVPILKLNSKP